MWDDFNSWFTSTVNDDPIFYGLVIILVSIALLALRIYFKESSRMKNHNIFSWKAYVSSWALIIMVFFMGLFLIINNV